MCYTNAKRVNIMLRELYGDIKMKIDRKCCFIGHKLQSLPFRLNENTPLCIALKEELKKEIVKMIEENFVIHFISGMEIGADLYAAQIVLDLKKQYPNLILEGILPCETQANRWNEKNREQYYDILAACDKTKLLQTHYTGNCKQKRNEYMFNNSDYMIAVWNGKPSCIGKTVKNAKLKGIKIIRIDPVTLITETI
jgi:uncharacterized phage-like protein YoqJ